MGIPHLAVTPVERWLGARMLGKGRVGFGVLSRP
jgi:hypothetical protein